MKSFLFAAALMCLAAPSQSQSLSAEIAAAHDAAKEYLSISAAKRAGWRSFGSDVPLMGIHYASSGAPDYVSGDRIDPRRPSNLMYSNVNGKMALVALSYNVRIAPGEALPEGFTGSQDVWHVHNYEVALDAAMMDRPLIGWLADIWMDGTMRQDGRTRQAMVHLWLIPNPDGQFASFNPALAYLDLGLPVDWTVDLDTSRGVSLATPKGCQEALESDFWIANVPRRLQRPIYRFCEELADEVRAAIPRGEAALNRTARSAWARLDGTLNANLTETQKARIAAIIEHGDHMQ